MTTATSTGSDVGVESTANAYTLRSSDHSASETEKESRGNASTSTWARYALLAEGRAHLNGGGLKRAGKVGKDEEEEVKKQA